MDTQEEREISQTLHALVEPVSSNARMADQAVLGRDDA